MPRTPEEAFDAFAEAVIHNQADAARVVTTPAGWGARGGPRALFHKVARRRGGMVRGDGPYLKGPRAAIRALLVRPDSKRPASIWVLLRDDDGFALEGATTSREHAGLFLEGRLPALLDVRDLPPSPVAAAWGTARIAQVVEGRLPTVEAIAEVSGLAHLGSVPRLASSRFDVLKALPGDDPAVGAYAELVARVEEAGRPAVLLVASPMPSVHRSEAAMALAHAYAALGMDTLLLAGSLDSARLARRFDEDPAPGLDGVLRAEHRVSDVLRPTGLEGLTLLPGGYPRPDEAGRLADGLPEVIEAARLHADVVVVDAPAIAAHAGFSSYAALPGAGVLLVESPWCAGRAALAQARARLEESGVRTLGFVSAPVAEPLADLPEPSERLRRAADGEGLGVELETFALDGVDRAAVGLRLHAPGQAGREVWEVLCREDDRWTLLSEAGSPALGVLLEGLGMDWSGFEVREGGPLPQPPVLPAPPGAAAAPKRGAPEPAAAPDELTAEISGLLSGLLEAALQATDDERSRETIAAALDEVQAAARARPGGPPSKVDLDPEALASAGPALAREVLQRLARAVESRGGEEGPRAPLEIDAAEILRRLARLPDREE